MKIAIHHRAGGFSDRWISYCEENHISYKLVNAYDTNIIQEVNDCDAFMWHFVHNDYKDVCCAKQILFSLEVAGKKVFPNFNTRWHFDDKVGQKYLFESIDAPLVPSYVFYSKKDALNWLKKTTFPKVFKLRGGAGASNVKLVKSFNDAESLVSKAFGKGFSQFDRLNFFKDSINKWLSNKAPFGSVCKGIGRLFIPTDFARMRNSEKGYVYFQEFIPKNDFDTRIVVVGDKIIGERRGCRKGDFRASGSNILMPDVTKVDVNCVKLAYNVCQALNLQIGVFDFVHDEQGKPLIVEISYGTSPDYTECEGYWDKDFNFHKSFVDLPAMIIESFISTL